MLSIYSSAFNLIKNNFNYKDALNNFSHFANEVVVAVNTSEDDTLIALKDYANERKNIRIIETDFSYEDPLLDGKIKNAALQATSEEFKINLDLDERIPIRHRSKWETLAYQLRFASFDSYLVPSLNLWGNLMSMRWDDEMNLNFKWYLHKGGLTRGAVDFAKLPDGKVDTSKSDTCELIYEDGALVKAAHITKDSCKNSMQEYLNFIENEGIFVFHLGYADFSDRALRNKNFWKKHWEIESGKENDIPTDKKDIPHHPTYLHNLRMWDE